MVVNALLMGELYNEVAKLTAEGKDPTHCWRVIDLLKGDSGYIIQPYRKPNVQAVSALMTAEAKLPAECAELSPQDYQFVSKYFNDLIEQEVERILLQKTQDFLAGRLDIVTKKNFTAHQTELELRRHRQRLDVQFKNNLWFAVLAVTGVTCEMFDGIVAALALQPHVPFDISIPIAVLIGLFGVISWLGFEGPAVARQSGVSLFSIHKSVRTSMFHMSVLETLLSSNKEVFVNEHRKNQDELEQLSRFSNLYAERHLRRFELDPREQFPLLSRVIKFLPMLTIAVGTAALIWAAFEVIALPIPIGYLFFSLSISVTYRVYEYISLDMKAIHKSYGRATGVPCRDLDKGNIVATKMRKNTLFDISPLGKAPPLEMQSWPAIPAC